MSKDEKKIAIAGFGFSGLAALNELVDQASNPLFISIFDKKSLDGSGIAFGGDSRVHPLNVKACEMGISEALPNGFFEWLEENKNDWQPLFPDLKISKDSYLPRKLYGLYLKSTKEKILSKAREKQIRVTFYHEEISSIELVGHLFTVKGKKGTQVKAEYLILATGVPPTKNLPFENKKLLLSKRYIKNIWFPPLESKIRSLNPAEVLIIGSGLTAVDALLSLKEADFKGKILIVSESGHFPESHSDENEGFVNEPFRFIPSKRILFLLKEFKEKWRYYRGEGIAWRPYFDSIRPFTSRLWHELSFDSKKKFFRYLFKIWNRHRHRMSSESFQAILELKSQITLLKGTIDKVVELEDGRFEILHECRNKAEKFIVDCVINCTGPIYEIRKRNDLLISSLIDQKLVFKDELEMGLKIENYSTLYCDGNGKIFAMGPLLFGSLFETTSVPEIRAGAKTVAETILNNFR